MTDSNFSQTPAQRYPDATGRPGEEIDAGRGRIFPCEKCGADLEFSIGEQSLQCPYCGAVKQIELPVDAPIVERDYLAMLAKLERLHEQGHDEDEQASNEHAIRCESCGGEVIFQGTLTSTHCPYCASPLQRDKIHDAPSRIPITQMDEVTQQNAALVEQSAAAADSLQGEAATLSRVVSVFKLDHEPVAALPPPAVARRAVAPVRKAAALALPQGARPVARSHQAAGQTSPSGESGWDEF